MRFHWFAQQYYTGLPEDYSKSIHSSWVTAPAAVTDPTQVGEDYHMYHPPDARRGSTGVGFAPPERTPPDLARDDAFTEPDRRHPRRYHRKFSDRPLRQFTGSVQSSLAGGGGDRDARLLVGRSDHCRDRVRHTHGHARSCTAYPRSSSATAFTRRRELIHRAWTAEAPFAFNGKLHQTPLCEPVASARPERHPDLDSRIGQRRDVGRGERRSTTATGYLSFHGTQNAKPIVDAFWEYTERNGANMNPNRMAFTQIICCADTDKEAKAQYADAVRYFYRQNRVALEFATPPGYLSSASLRQQLLRQQVISSDERQKADRGELDFWEYDELGYIIAGRPSGWSSASGRSFRICASAS